MDATTTMCARATISSVPTRRFFSVPAMKKIMAPSLLHTTIVKSKARTQTLCGAAASGRTAAAATPSDDAFNGADVMATKGVELPDRSRGGLFRFHVDSLPTSEGMIAQVQGEELLHMVKVLRLKVKDRIEIFDGRGGFVNGQLVAIGRHAAEVLCLENPKSVPLVRPHWHVAAAFGTLKGGRGDWLVEKCTELGARSLTPLLTQRSQAEPRGRRERWQRIAMAATKQCQRLHCLDVRDAVSLRNYMPQIMQVEVALVASAGAEPLVQRLEKLSTAPNTGILFVGPEGDFTDDELKSLIEAGATRVGLGPRRLRVETAAVAMLAAVTFLGDKHASYLQDGRTL